MTGSPAYLHGQGFMAAINWKLAGKVSNSCGRLMVTTLSSMSWRHDFQDARAELWQLVQE